MSLFDLLQLMLIQEQKFFFIGGASSNSARINIFQLTSALPNYREKKILFMYISEDDSEIELKNCTSSHG